MKLLLELLPKYVAHVEKHPHTLLVKFFGLYRVTPENGSKVCPLSSALHFPSIHGQQADTIAKMIFSQLHFFQQACMRHLSNPSIPSGSQHSKLVLKEACRVRRRSASS